MHESSHRDHHAHAEHGHAGHSHHEHHHAEHHEVHHHKRSRKLAAFQLVVGTIYMLTAAACVYVAWQAGNQAERACMESLDVISRIDELSATPATITYSSTIQEQYDRALERLDRMGHRVDVLDRQREVQAGKLSELHHAQLANAKWIANVHADELAYAAKLANDLSQSGQWNAAERDKQSRRIGELAHRVDELARWARETHKWQQGVVKVIDNPYCKPACK